MEKIKCSDTGCVRAKGSNALIYGFGYHDIFGDVLRSPHFSEYAKAPVMTLLALDVEILLKGIIMAATGTEPWKRKSKKGHSIEFLLNCIPSEYGKRVYEDLENEGFSEERAKVLIIKMDKAFIDYRYHYENIDQEIDQADEIFLKKLWAIIYELSLDAQQEYMDKYV